MIRLDSSIQLPVVLPVIVERLPVNFQRVQRLPGVQKKSGILKTILTGAGIAFGIG